MRLWMRFKWGSPCDSQAPLAGSSTMHGAGIPLARGPQLMAPQLLSSHAWLVAQVRALYMLTLARACTCLHRVAIGLECLAGGSGGLGELV